MSCKAWPRPILTGMLVAGLLVSVGAGGCLCAQEADKSSGDAKATKAEFPVKMTVHASKPDADGKQQILVTLTIEKGRYGYYLHANPTCNRDIVGYETTMKIAGKGLLGAMLTYPAGDLISDKFFGSYRIYQGKVLLKADLRRKISDNEPLVLSVHVRPFDAVGCRWPPRILKETVR